MPKKTPRAAADQGVQPEPPAPVDSPPHPPKLLDPPRIVARILLERALAAAGIRIEDAARDGAVTIIIVPAADWADIVRRAWSEWARPDSDCCEKSTRSYSSVRVWTSLTIEEAPRTAFQKDHTDVFAKALSKGLHVAGFTADSGWLPEDLVRTADFHLTLPPFTAVDIGQMILELCVDVPTENVTDEEVVDVSPLTLRLARRPGQSADNYIQKLKRLLLKNPKPPSGDPLKEETVAPTLDRVHGMDQAVAWGMALAEDLKAYKAGEIPWSRVDRGCLLSGPPGVGKTIFARSLAATCKVPLISGTYGKWQASGTGHLGDFLKAMQKTFSAARAAAPCILFVDEIDSFPDREKAIDHNRNYTIETVNSFLAEIDGSERLDGVVLIGACNHPSRLDPALVRSGRLDRHIRIRMPDRAALAAILREHLGDDLTGADLSGAATAAVGITGADCEQIVRGARRRARTANRPLAMADLLAEIEGDIPIPPRDLWIAAVHEAGHAVAAAVQRPGCLGDVCLATRGDAGGHTQANYNVTRYPSADDLRGMVIMTLAGRAAEEVIAGTPTSGAGGGPGCDLSQATSLALEVHTSLGLDDTGSLLWRGMHDARDIPKVLAAHPVLAERVGDYLSQAYDAALELVGSHKDAVLAVARLLLKQRVIDGPVVEEMVRSHIDRDNGPRNSDWGYPWSGRG